MNLKKNDGFTLVEMAVTLIVFGIILAISFLAFNRTLQAGRLNSAVSDANQLAAALNSYNITATIRLTDTTTATTRNFAALSESELQELRQTLASQRLLPQFAINMEGFEGFKIVMAHIKFDGGPNGTNRFVSRPAEWIRTNGLEGY